MWLNGSPNHKLEGYEILEDVQILYEGNENIREKSKAKKKTIIDGTEDILLCDTRVFVGSWWQWWLVSLCQESVEEMVGFLLGMK